MQQRWTFFSVPVVVCGLAVVVGAQGQAPSSVEGKVAQLTERAAAVESSVSGTVSALDPRAGKVEVKTARGVAEVYAAPEVLRRLKEGARVVIDLDLINGTISAIDQQTGRVEVKTEHGTTKLNLPPETITKLKVGDQVALELESAQEAVEETKQ